MKKYDINKSKITKALNVCLREVHGALPVKRCGLVFDIRRCVQDLVIEVMLETSMVLLAKPKKGNK